MALALFTGVSRPSIASQLANDVLSDNNPCFQGFPVAKWRGRLFINDQRLWKKGSRAPKTWIKDHGIFLREVTGGTMQKGRLWVCRRCDERSTVDTIYSLDATSGASAHLERKHHVVPGSTGTPETPESSGSDALFRAPKRRRFADISEVAEIRELLIGHIVNADRPFDAFSERYLAEAFCRFDASLAQQIPWSGSSQRRQLTEIFAKKKAAVRESILSSLSRVHLAFDLWTSGNNFAIMAVSAHYLDKRGVQQQRLIALTHHQGDHSGDNLAATLLRVVRDWGLEDRIGTLVSDNATNNDTCTKAFFAALNPFYTEQDSTERRIRCYGHILNLVGRAFLRGLDDEVFEEESQRDPTNDPDTLASQLEAWRASGPVNKLRNIIKYIRKSPQRSEDFQRLAEEASSADDWLLHQESKAELRLILNNDTRWNSTYLMLARAITKRAHIQSFLVQLQVSGDTGIPVEAYLTGEDWLVLTELKAVLEPLYKQTMLCQGWGENGSHGYLWEILSGFEFLLDKMEAWRAFFDEPSIGAIQESQRYLPHHRPERPRRGRRARISPEPRTQALPPHVQDEFGQASANSTATRLAALPESSQAYIRASITNAWQKLNQYYTKLGESPLFAAAILLHPGRGKPWLESHWDSGEQLQWLKNATEDLEAFWIAWYRDETSPGSSPPRGARAAPVSIGSEEEVHDWMMNDLKRVKSRNLEATEIDRYFRAELPLFDINFDPIKWWIDNQALYPTLSKLALDLFSIPAMAADCERAFSLAKLTLTSQRLSMGPERLEMVQCLKNWLRRDAATLGGIFYTQGMAAGGAA